jgi:hypothetical protein
LDTNRLHWSSSRDCDLHELDGTSPSLRSSHDTDIGTQFIVSLLYAINFAPRTAWGGLSLAMFQDLGINIRLGIAGVAAVSSEWWCWECVGLASSFLGAEALASQSVLLTSASLFYQIPYALSVACAVRVGSESISILVTRFIADDANRLAWRTTPETCEDGVEGDAWYRRRRCWHQLSAPSRSTCRVSIMSTSRCLEY